jgi:hypothetical protein
MITKESKKVLAGEFGQTVKCRIYQRQKQKYGIDNENRQ